MAYTPEVFTIAVGFANNHTENSNVKMSMSVAEHLQLLTSDRSLSYCNIGRDVALKWCVFQLLPQHCRAKLTWPSGSGLSTTQLTLR